jgi:hypothetical protein
MKSAIILLAMLSYSSEERPRNKMQKADEETHQAPLHRTPVVKKIQDFFHSAPPSFQKIFQLFSPKKNYTSPRKLPPHQKNKIHVLFETGIRIVPNTIQKPLSDHSSDDDSSSGEDFNIPGQVETNSNKKVHFKSFKTDPQPGPKIYTDALQNITPTDPTSANKDQKQHTYHPSCFKHQEKISFCKKISIKIHHFFNTLKKCLSFQK